MSKTIATRDAYGEAIVELGHENENIVVLDADLSAATRTAKFAETFPERFFNSGIAEANMTSMSAGLSTIGLIPFCSTFAMFGTGRAYEQVRNSIAYPGMNVKICDTHAGITAGEDGGSHQCIEDIALMRVLPGMTVICPADATQAKQAIKAVAAMNGPAYVRLSRYATPVLEEVPFEIGKGVVRKDGDDIVLFATGVMVSTALEAAAVLAEKGVSAAVVDIHTIKPLDEALVINYAQKCGKVVTLEEHSVIGGLGDAVASALMGKGSFEFKKIGVQDEFGQSGSVPALLKEYGLDLEGVLKSLEDII